jgi:CRP/FNR family transcriptional regulator, cyclic AMP receptor protein
LSLPRFKLILLFLYAPVEKSMSATPITPVVQNSDFADALSSVSIFQDLPVPVMDSICESSDRRQYDAGHTVFSAGNYDASEFFIITSGRVRISLVDPETGAMVIEELDEGAVFGLELALAEGAADAFQTLSVTAEEDLDLIAIDAAAFRALASQRPSLMRNIAMFFAQELSTLRLKTIFAEAAPHQRVYAALLHFVERDEMTGSWRIQQMPKHRQLAEQAGVEEAVTADAVATLIQDGVVQRDYPGMVINDISRLNELAS